MPVSGYEPEGRQFESVRAHHPTLTVVKFRRIGRSARVKSVNPQCGRERKILRFFLPGRFFWLGELGPPPLAGRRFDGKPQSSWYGIQKTYQQPVSPAWNYE